MIVIAMFNTIKCERFLCGMEVFYSKGNCTTLIESLICFFLPVTPLCMEGVFNALTCFLLVTPLCMDGVFNALTCFYW